MNAAVMADTSVRARVLCVDDDPRLLEGLALHLRRSYELHTATSGAAALELLAQLGGVTVVVSDMKMPGMDGATFLNRVMQLYPDATRILLTGEPGQNTAALAVNEGQIFRFLTKPCPPDRLKAGIEAGIKQHQLVTAERVLLHETLLGSIRALVDVLAMTNPVAFGRASRIKRLASEFAASALGRTGLWQLEAAALLSQLGYLSLPEELVEKIYYGHRLSAEETTMAATAAKVPKKLLGHIPRLEPVVQILGALGQTPEQQAALSGDIALGARLLTFLLDYDALLTQGQVPEEAITTLRARGARYDHEFVEKLAEQIGSTPVVGELRELALRDVRPGMTLIDDVRTERGALLIPRGFEVSLSLLERVRNFGPTVLAGKVRVRLPD
jgi:response regulator RpfG family c-di-GMP phosphodiesterase